VQHLMQQDEGDMLLQKRVFRPLRSPDAKRDDQQRSVEGDRDAELVGQCALALSVYSTSGACRL
jgi:hypothetical protein